MTNRVDGIVLSNTNRYDLRVAYLHSTSIPYVAFGRAGDEYDYAWGLGTGDWGLVTGDWGLVTGDW